jgi:L-threonylcarbamoyladenylate synthase
MTTIIAITDPTARSQAIAALQAGEAIAFPTDTVYGVGGGASNPRAILRLYEAKQRPRTMAIPVLLADPADLAHVARSIPPAAAALAQRYWPGGLSLIVPAADYLPPELLSHGDSVAVRVPDHAWLRELIRELGEPLAATSANRHGAAPPRLAGLVAEQLGPALALVVDGGASSGDTPSTVVDCTGAEPRVLRQGSVTIEAAV